MTIYPKNTNLQSSAEMDLGLWLPYKPLYLGAGIHKISVNLVHSNWRIKASPCFNMCFLSETFHLENEGSAER